MNRNEYRTPFFRAALLPRREGDQGQRRRLRHCQPDPLHHAGEIVAEHERRLVGQHEPELAGHDLGVERVNPGGGDPDERVALASLRLGHLPCPQRAVLAVLADNKGLHVTASFTDSGP
ncbi:MAG TPA: hypothetical protein VMK84_18015 [Streptosporangiaceae bacterium]|nr:hypothetical protein [Streptosporangiaceae bacterium]